MKIAIHTGGKRYSEEREGIRFACQAVPEEQICAEVIAGENLWITGILVESIT